MDDRSPAEFRGQLVAELPAARYETFLFYLMGPYKSFNLEYVLDEEERAAVEVEDLPGPIQRLFQHEAEMDEAQALLRRVQGQLRATGFNAFLAVDAGPSLDDVDAATQSVAFARASNATAFVLPYLGHNFGVGEEAGSILETLSAERRERLVFVHEQDVTSAMLRASKRRWDLRIETYEDEADLVDTLRRFGAGIMHRERRGDLKQLGTIAHTEAGDSAE